jgi:translation initiation factor IF-2
VPQQQPAPQLASVPVPQPAPEPKVGEAPADKPTSIAGLIGNMFGGDKANAATEADSEPVVLRGTSKPQVAAAPKRPAPPAPRPQPAPAAVASNPPEPAARPTPRVAQAAPPARADTPTPAQAAGNGRELRTAFSAPGSSSNGLLSGAQPVVPVGSFDARWSGLR